jgi:cystine transport system substrate-binding protein
MKRLFVLMLSMLLIVSACGTSSKNNNANKSQDLLQSIKSKGKILIGTEGTYAPFTFHDPSTGKLTGFDVELAKEVAKRIGVKTEFKETQWDAMFAGLDAKRFDMIANEVGVKPERQQKYDFSNGYITSSAALITNTDNTKVKKFEDVKGLKSAQSMTSNYADIARKYGAVIVGVDGFEQAISLVTSKRADVTINDKITYLDYKKKKPDAPVQMVATSPDASQSAFMFRKGNKTLVDAVNKQLKAIIDDGTYDKISKKWFGENVLK